MRYFVQYYGFCLFSMDFRPNEAQIDPFEICGHRKCQYINFIRHVVRHTMDNNRLVEFRKLKCVISVNIMDFAFFPWIFAQIKTKLSLYYIGSIKNLAIFHFAISMENLVILC